MILFLLSSKEFFEHPLPPGWKWASTWTLDMSQFVDTDGWAYGPDYQSLKWPPNSPKSGTKSARDAVRRRRWIRTRQEVDDWARTNQNFLDTSIGPGCSSVLPWRSMSRDSNQCLRIRPSTANSQTSYAWGRPVSVEKDSLSVDQASLSRQTTMKHGNKIPIAPLRLDELEKKDLLWCCPGSGGRLFWLSIGTDASVLQTDLNTPVYDWKISVSSPLRLENRLPCSAEFKIWERLSDGRNIERQNGFVSSRGTVQIYTADIRNPIYVMLFVQGGWVVEKVIFLFDCICDHCMHAYIYIYIYMGMILFFEKHLCDDFISPGKLGPCSNFGYGMWQSRFFILDASPAEEKVVCELFTYTFRYFLLYTCYSFLHTHTFVKSYSCQLIHYYFIKC